MSVTHIEGRFDDANGHYTLVVGRFNSFVVESLVDGALDTLKRHGVDANNIRVIRVPGAFEIPLVAQKIAQQGKDDAIITLGAVIRGGTPHFEYVSGEASSGISKVGLDHGIPVISATGLVSNAHEWR